MDKVLIVLDDHNKYEEKEIGKWIKKNDCNANVRGGFRFFLFEDRYYVDEPIKDKLLENHVSLENDIFYIILHERALKNNIGSSIDDYTEAFKNCQISIYRHVPNSFYDVCMPKLIDENIHVDFDRDIKPFFKDNELEEKWSSIFKNYAQGTNIKSCIKILNEHHDKKA